MLRFGFSMPTNRSCAPPDTFPNVLHDFHCCKEMPRIHGTTHA